MSDGNGVDVEKKPNINAHRLKIDYTPVLNFTVSTIGEDSLID